LSTTAFTKLNIAVFAPIASAIVEMAMAANVGLERNERNA
jgi:hypothetical protein